MLSQLSEECFLTWQVIELIDGARGGVLSQLSEECFFPNGSDKGWLEKMINAHSKSPLFAQGLKNRDGFTISHYAGKVLAVGDHGRL